MKPLQTHFNDAEEAAAQRRFAVQPGDVWKVGDHILVCGDSDEDAASDLVRLHGPIDVSFVNPPWTEAAAKAYRRRAGVTTPGDFQSLLYSLINAAALARKSALFQIGAQYRGYLEGMVLRTRRFTSPSMGESRSIYEPSMPVTLDTATILGTYATAYGKEGRCNMLHVTWSPDHEAQRVQAAIPPKLDHYQYVAWFLGQAAAPGETIFDPVCGWGLVGEVAARNGSRFVGMEINPARVAIAIQRLVEHGDMPYERIAQSCR